MDRIWRGQRPVEARSSLGGSPYDDRIRAVEGAIEARDHIVAFLEIIRLQRLRDAADANGDWWTEMKLNREIRGLGHKVFGETITGIDANGSPIIDQEAEMFERVAGMQGGGIGRTGKVGERALRMLGGRPQAFFRTDWGRRYIDQLVKGIGHESKVGYTVLNDKILIQIAKDAELIRKAEIRGSVWVFFRSPVTGAQGPSQALQDALKAAGITWKMGVP